MKDLLDDIRQNAGLQYVSDLKLKKNERWILEVIKSIPEDDYGEEQWREAFQYITGNVQSKAKNKEALINYLKTFAAFVDTMEDI